VTAETAVDSSDKPAALHDVEILSDLIGLGSVWQRARQSTQLKVRISDFEYLKVGIFCVKI